MFAVLAAIAAPTFHLRLERGAMLADYGMYSAVEDTTLVREQPDRNFGGDYTLRGGPGSVILIRFRDLAAALGGRARVSKAQLVLTIDSLGEPQLERVGAVNGNWAEGPMLVQGRKAINGEAVSGATWKQRRMNGVASPWGESGAAGAEDVRWLPEARVSRQGDTLVIAGIEQALQYGLDHPWDDGGFELRFRNECAFTSSQALIGRPALEIDYTIPPQSAGIDLAVLSIEPVSGSAGTSSKYVAKVANLGSAPARGLITRWIVADRRTSAIESNQSIPAGGTAEFQLSASDAPVGPDHRTPTIAFSIETKQGDEDPSSNGLEISRTARPVRITAAADWAALGFSNAAAWQTAAVRYLNEVALEQSRFAFAPEGSIERFRPASSAESDSALNLDLSGVTLERNWRPALVRAIVKAYGCPLESDAARDPFSGFSCIGDTRFDGAISPFIPLSYDPAGSSPLMAAMGTPTGLLASHEVAAIETFRQGLGMDTPSLATIKLAMPDGSPIAQAEVALFDTPQGASRSDIPYATVTTDERGVLTLPSRGTKPKPNPLGDISPASLASSIEMRVTGNGQTEFVAIRGWQILDAFRRTRLPIVSLEKRVSLTPPSTPSSENLAKGRSVTDSNGTSAEKLAALVDGDPSSSVSVSGGNGAFVEIDLGRDRSIAEVQLVAKEMWNQFDFILYSTGQDAATSPAWAREFDWRTSSTTKGAPEADGKRIAYRAGSGRFRFIRIINRSPQSSATISEIRVVPPKSQ